LERLNEIITKSQIFISTFFTLERAARDVWGRSSGRAIPYDPRYKGLMEVLIDAEGLLCGFKVHWPNNSESTYRRTEDGIEMINCMLNLKHADIELMVGQYARNPDAFSPLVEAGGVPIYTKVEGTQETPSWPA
jgi:hypothetical protein